jgi:hypothetical protein
MVASSAPTPGPSVSPTTHRRADQRDAGGAVVPAGAIGDVGLRRRTRAGAEDRELTARERSASDRSTPPCSQPCKPISITTASANIDSA